MNRREFNLKALIGGLVALIPGMGASTQPYNRGWRHGWDEQAEGRLYRTSLSNFEAQSQSAHESMNRLDTDEHGRLIIRGALTDGQRRLVENHIASLNNI